MDSYRSLMPSKESEPEVIDTAFYDLAVSPGWKQLKAIIDTYVADLDNGLNIEASDSVENIGFKYMAASLAKTYLKQVVSIVETSYGIVKDREESK